jgi:hypothetical protein
MSETSADESGPGGERDSVSGKAADEFVTRRTTWDARRRVTDACTSLSQRPVYTVRNNDPIERRARPQAWAF